MIPFLFPDMKQRSYQSELMDRDDVDTTKLINTVKQFTLINQLFTRSRSLIMKHIVRDMEKDKSREYTFLDIGAGGCDIAIWLSGLCRRKGISLKIFCLDYDKRIVSYAEKRCLNYPDIQIIQGSAFELEKFGSFDYIFANHFLHHLTYEEIRMVIGKISSSAEKLFLLNDLRRSKRGYLAYTLFTGLFLHKSFAFYDGRLSIKRGFLPEEFHREVISKMDSRSSIQYASAAPSRFYLYGRREN